MCAEAQACAEARGESSTLSVVSQEHCQLHFDMGHSVTWNLST